MPFDAAIHPVPHRLPEAHGPGMILFHQGRDSLYSLLGQPLLDFGHQPSGDPSPSVARVNDQPVDVASPAVERPDDRADDLPIGLGDRTWAGLSATARRRSSAVSVTLAVASACRQSSSTASTSSTRQSRMVRFGIIASIQREGSAAGRFFSGFTFSLSQLGAGVLNRA